MERLFASDAAEEAWFTDAFLAQVPLERMDSIVAQIVGDFGAVVGVEGERPPFRLVFERGVATVQIALDESRRIAGLLITELAPIASDLESAASNLEPLPGTLSWLVTIDGQARAAMAPDEPLAVGSTFKLAVLAALLERIDSGELAWDDVVVVRESWRSLPTGTVHQWPVGSAVTLETLATLMISISDNTATDALIDIVGRERVEAFSPRNAPFLTTREAFVLKNPANAELLERFREADPDGRRRLLETEVPDLPMPGLDLFDADPVALDVEWFFSVRELCALMGDVAELPLMVVNPGVADPAAWDLVAFKGGAEPGVLNLTTWVRAVDGTIACVSVTQNRPDAPLEELRMVTLFRGLLQALLGPDGD